MGFEPRRDCADNIGPQRRPGAVDRPSKFMTTYSRPVSTARRWAGRSGSCQGAWCSSPLPSIQSTSLLRTRSAQASVANVSNNDAIRSLSLLGQPFNAT